MTKERIPPGLSNFPCGSLCKEHCSMRKRVHILLQHFLHQHFLHRRLKLISGFLLSCFFLILVSPLHAQRDQFTFEHLSLEHGLSDSIVTCLLQDNIGFLWIGTENGLNRYDGYNFTIYRHDPKDPQSLSSNEIQVLYEDAEGTLWIGTDDGLQTYNRELDQFGHYPYNPDDPNSLKNNTIQAIYEDQAGVLWIGTEEGLHTYNRLERTFTRYQSVSLQDESEDEKDEDDEQDETEEGNEDVEDPETSEVSENALIVAGENIRVIYQERSGVLWFGTDKGLNRYDGQSVRTYLHDPEDPDSLGHDQVNVIYADRAGNLWIGADGGGLHKFDRETEQFIHYRNIPDDPATISHDQVNAIYEDHAGELWIGTLNGLNKFDPQSERFIRCQHDPVNPRSLSYSEIGVIFEDRSGVLWIGTDGGGLNKFNRCTEHFLHYQHDPYHSQSLSHNRVQALYEDRDGFLWIGTEVGGLDRLNRETEEFFHYQHDPKNPHSLSINEVNALYEDSAGILWVGTDEGGLNRLDRETGQFTHYLPDPEDPHSISHDAISVLYEDREGVLWIGMEDDGGLNRFDRETASFTIYRHEEDDPASLSGPDVWAIFEDHDGVLWVGTSEGLNRFDRETDEFYHYNSDPENPKSLSHNTVWSIYEDRAGILWIGTSGGLNKFDRENESFTHYTEQDGLPHDVIYGILEDDAGHLWLSTSKGLSRFEPKSETCKNYGINELQNITFVEGAYHKSRSGEMFFGGMQGFNAFYPEKIQDNPHRPSVVMTDFSIFNRSIPIGQNAEGRMLLEKSITSTRELTLSYQDSVFSFEFAALDYTIPEKNQYAYKMEGFDQEWNEIGTRRIATYTNLPAGTYTFRVKGSNNDRVWNEEGVALRLTITPPFWETAWFRSALVVCLIGTAYGVHKLRIRQMRAYQQRLEYEVQERTKELVEKNQQIQRQQHQLIESEKMAALGQLVAGIAHEINTPLGAIRASIGNICDFLSDTTHHLPHLLQELSQSQQHDFFALIEKALLSKKQLTSREERQFRRALRRKLEEKDIENADDIADMLVDMGVYDGIEPYVPLFRHEQHALLLKMAYNITAQHSNSDNITKAVDRASKIIFALKSYAHYDSSGKMIPSHIPDNIDVVLTLYHNQLKQGIEVITRYEDVPEIPCYPDDLTQVWTNLIHNAIQAMEGTGKLEITVTRAQCSISGEHWSDAENQCILITMTDSGPGVPDDIQDRMFDPFFTTKPPGEGSGLGLNIVQKIIERHQGRIKVESQPGATTFSVLLPIPAK